MGHWTLRGSAPEAGMHSANRHRASTRVIVKAPSTLVSAKTAPMHSSLPSGVALPGRCVWHASGCLCIQPIASPRCGSAAEDPFALADSSERFSIGPPPPSDFGSLSPTPSSVSLGTLLALAPSTLWICLCASRAFASRVSAFVCRGAGSCESGQMPLRADFGRSRRHWEALQGQLGQLSSCALE